jgi:hypothetical protein
LVENGHVRLAHIGQGVESTLLSSTMHPDRRQSFLLNGLVYRFLLDALGTVFHVKHDQLRR